MTGLSIRAPVLALALGALAAGSPALVRAESFRLNARVVWVRDDLAYLALLDTLTVSPGLRLAFHEGRAEVATGLCTGARAGDVIEARIVSGSLARVKKLERILVTGDHPSWSVPRVVRWGYPSRARQALLVRCDRYVPRPEALAVPYRAEARRDDGWRLVRDERDGAAWPDTIEVRLFDSPTDQEIAFQRGDIDAALFWPGEASDHLRGLPAWGERQSASREQGLLVATGEGELGEGAFAPLAAMNETLFRGDLRPYLRPDGIDGAAPPRSLESAAVAYDVDPALPGAGTLRRALAAAGAARGDSRSTAGPAVRLTYLPVSVDPDSIARALLPDGDDGGTAPRSVRFFVLDCPVVARSQLLPFLRRVGVRGFVNLFDCRPPAGKR